jgi:hypothetical protein
VVSERGIIEVMVDFRPFQKIARLNRECVVTEKIDGTNGVVYVGEDGMVQAGSRSRWITVTQDNHGFAKWVEANADELRKLGPGFHYGEWWGSGIQRGYGLAKGEKRFSLFNVSRWSDQDKRPACCDVVPELVRGLDVRAAAEAGLTLLRVHGSQAAPGFARPEGVVVFHSHSGILFKVTLEHDEARKSEVAL